MELDGYLNIKNTDFGDSDLRIFHYNEIDELVNIAMDYNGERINNLVFNKEGSSELEYLFDRRAFTFCEISNFKRKGVLNKVIQFSNNFKFDDFYQVINIEHIAIKKSSKGYKVKITFSNPFGICKFECSEIIFSQEYLDD